jgi:peptide/nickel transport system permease protein
MLVFVIRRLIVSFVILLLSTFLMYVLVASAGDPLGDLRLSTSPNKAQQIAGRVAALHLDQPFPERYFGWLKGTASCAVPGPIPGFHCTLGYNRERQEVAILLQQAIGSTMRLVVLATVLAVTLGIAVGVISALRQYSGFDYTITFTAFLFFSLPIFWVAVLLKQYLAIKFNDWLEKPTIPLVVIAVLAVLSALMWGALIGGPPRRRWAVRGIALVVSAGVLSYLSAVEWFRRPALGPGLITLAAIGIAFGVCSLTAGLHRRNVLYACLAMAMIGIGAQFAITPMLDSPSYASWLNIFLFGVVTVVVGVVVGYLLGGLDKGQAARAAVATGLLIGAVIVVDCTLRAFHGYIELVGGRPISTAGSKTPNFEGTFWQNQLDTATHIILPTLAIMLISFASYNRYSRASMLDTLNQDYVRTARSKGLTERTVVMRHAFRNALIPVTTLAAYDFGAVFSGAIITEVVFSWRGMGFLFQQNLLRVDPNPVMAFYIVTAVAVVLFNLLADIAYAYLDPRIRLS